MSEAIHNLWGRGEIKSPPIYSKTLDEYVVIFKPETEDFTIPVPDEELTVE